MGCDIHIFIEYRKQNENWLSDGEFGFNRNYYAFALMANVRNDGTVTPISEQRGLPEDVNQYTKDSLEDYHSLSWLTFSEFEKVESECSYYESLVCRKAKELIDTGYEVRIVFGFDS